ncbi:MAG: DUF4399 domain-containing protein [Caldilineaceae bacterium]
MSALLRPSMVQSLRQPSSLPWPPLGWLSNQQGAIHPDAGHFHILVDTDFVPQAMSSITDDQHIHGKGQMTTTCC